MLKFVKQRFSATLIKMYWQIWRKSWSAVWTLK